MVSGTGFVAQILWRAGSDFRRNFTCYVGQLQCRLVHATQQQRPALAGVRNRSSWRISRRAGTNYVLGGVFGQTILPNTTAGYVVSANGQSLAALNLQLGTSIPGGPVTSAQQSVQTVPQSVTSCNPCVTVGLTPARLAQFLPLNTVNATANGTPFPNSNVPGIEKFVPFNFTLGSSSTFSRNVSLDTGWPDFHVHYPGSPSNFLTIAANGSGTQETFNIASSPGVASPYNLAYSPSSGSNYLGIGFSTQNSALFNLAGQQVGYSPNFVTDANIGTTGGSPLVIGSSSQVSFPSPAASLSPTAARRP